MQQELLTHHLTVKVAPSTYSALTEASEREGASVGAIVRRAIRAELDGCEAHALDPYVTLPSDEINAQIHEAVSAIGDADAIQRLLNAITDELVGVTDASFQTLEVLQADEAHRRLERASGYLQQASGHLLRASFRVKALRVHEGMVLAGYSHIASETGGDAS